MSLIKDLNEAVSLTEREASIRDYFLDHPEHVVNMSCKDLGEATYTSAATVTRFCQKFGCKGYPEFKLRFLSDVKGGGIVTEADAVQLSDRENMVTLLQKMSDTHENALDAARKALSLPQLLRIQKLLQEHPYIDFYAYDTNIHLAQYASAQFFHAGKIAATYSETNVQVLSTLAAQPGHLAILLSHTGENKKLIELARLLRRGKVKMIIITSGKETPLGRLADEFLFAPTTTSFDRLWFAAYSSAAKYLLDLLFSIAFSTQYSENMLRNQRYEVLGDAFFWGLESSK